MSNTMKELHQIIHSVTDILEHNSNTNYRIAREKAEAGRDGYNEACEDFNKALRARLEEEGFKTITDDLMKIYQELKKEIENPSEDKEENYTNGYHWGHRNGQIELIEKLLNIDTGGRK
ncbi:hypothetical protein R2R35_14115 [Anaerocolumna sp. AGMB13020]|uniref:hypothetical protein n=1 Tax=Anaerocolumna sp. AGMB13020 TaxID=3081750 RepID=UPI002953743E|nr:hypothetical protein [Anaerocolumna sp. AGMB13020]WOO34932.1 hypothetical protein R2R35_14115 [Anaerocolumna sp. AGMB13020]